ncbi:MAG: prolyl oligopeptidase family serine peptidase, partial [Candidatus Hodarchaeota archaeon]
MIKNKQKLPYSQWKPTITPEDVFSDIITPEEIKNVGRTIYWLEQRPAEQGRVALVKCDESGQISDVTPKEYWIRTRVHEYGGGAYTLNDQYVYFVNFKDQRIYRQSLTEKQLPQPLTPKKNLDGSLGKYGALELSSNGTQLVFVYEKEYADKENENFIAVLDLTSEELREPAILACGNDFYADPKISPDGKRIVWLTWNHPKMPWDYTELIVAKFDEMYLVTGSEQKIAGGLNVSVCLPKFDQHGNLYYVMDEAGQGEKSIKNWWNLYCYKNGKTELITKELAEFGMPLWVLGQSGYSFLSSGNLICRTIAQGKANLVVVDPKKKECSLLDLPFTEYDSLQIDGNDDLVFVGASPLTPPAIIKLNLELMKITILKPSTTLKISEEDLSIPKFISYPTSDGKMAYGYLYMPKNSKYKAPEDEKPPLIVIVHGGPTGRTSSALYLRKGIQFWTSQGYAVLDVEYRGSTGYGRNYRDALLGECGVIDALDIKDGVNFLLKEGLVSKKIVIRGGSAGGYAVQRALTLFPELFSAGASYYGIGNLLTLVEGIHKFESHYLDSLLGASLAEGLAIYQERSPINHLDKLRAPMILFQGLEDKIVTPEV